MSGLGKHGRKADQEGRTMMLVLTRTRGKKVMIGDDIQIVVLEARDGRVRLGFVAPPEVKIHRLEVWQRIQDELRTGKKQA